MLDWLRDLDKEERRIIGLDLMRAQFGWPIGMPLVRSLKEGLWHGFIKKTQKTPTDDMALAQRRMKEVTK